MLEKNLRIGEILLIEKKKKMMFLLEGIFFSFSLFRLMKTNCSSICSLKEILEKGFINCIQWIFPYRGQYLMELKKYELASLCIHQLAEIDEGKCQFAHMVVNHGKVL